ncbi:MAG: hypothetical protein ACD_75C00516G0010 [uncultured bacterium]|nr:MAG: hypothetical protein ACD_75C00516G0010 [uncultured bacterium]
MGNALRYLSLLLLIAAGGALSASVSVEAASDSEEGILVGRISHVEGKLLRYIEEEKDWVVTVKDSPFGLEDALYSGDDTKAEFIMPNRTWLRVGENTQVQLIALNPDTTTVDVASGLARLYNKSDDTVIKVTTPFGYVVAPDDTVFDLYVGDESLEVIAVRGTVDFVHDGSNARYEIEDGSFSIIANKDETAKGNGKVDSEWDDWNGEREILWAKRLRSRSYSEDYLPEPIREESYALDESGEWESVYYEGAYRDMWRPTRVDRGWRPFTVGRWSVYYGDQCWVPDEPFGYVTHHYGSWVYIESSHYWYWAPPVPRIVTGGPLISISFGWYPGRVGWIHSGPSIGWVPLAPHETYYGYRPWGHRTVIYDQTTVFNINIVNYRYLDEAVVIDRDRFYRGSSYTPYVQRNVNRDTLINDYRPTTVINNTVINNYNTDTRRFAYNDVEVSRKPHATVIDRITDNRKMRSDSGRINRERIENDLTRVNAVAEPQSRTELRSPTVAGKLVDADKIDKPLNTLSLKKKEIKGKDRERRVIDDQQRGAKGQEESGQVKVKGDSQDGKQRIRSPRDAQKSEIDQGAADRSLQKGEKVRRPNEPVKPDQMVGTDQQEEKRQLRSPRDTQKKGAEQLSRQQEENQGSKGPKLRRQQQEEERSQGRPEQEIQQRQTDESQKRHAPPQSPRLKKRDQQEELQQEQTPAPTGDKEPRQRSRKEVNQVRDADKPDDTPRVQSPRAPREKGKEQLGRQQDEVRQQKEDQGRQEQELQQRKQKEDQGRQEQELQRRKQQEEQGRQQQELQQRKQQEEQGRKEQEQQRRQQEENQVRQKQEKQRQQPEEVQKPQEQQQQHPQKKKSKKEEEEAAAAAAANPR